MRNALLPADILLPQNVDMSKWAVVSCDQFTSEPKYWQALADYVGGEKSTLDLIFPEVYLGDNDEARIAKINATMEDYLFEGVFKTIKNSYVLVERTTASGVKRVGIIGAVDLEDFDFTANAKSVIRPTEGVVPSRIPPRLKIRENASMELPHIMLLVDDPSGSVIETLYQNRDSFEKLYDFELNMGGGHIRGWLVPKEASQGVIEKIEALNLPEVQIKKYGSDAGIMLAVGDGNHSVATAKVCYDELKKTLSEEERANCPARYMLAELVNLHGGGMEFSPIHRYFRTRDDDFVAKLKASLYGEGRLKIIYKDGEEYIKCPENPGAAITEVQRLVEAYLSETGAEIDYVHDLVHLKECVDGSDGMGIVMPAFSRSDLFGYVVNVGNLPKKAFSIGEAEQKRYYLECRKIK